MKKDFLIPRKKNWEKSKMNILPKKICCDCGISLSFREFCQINSSLSNEIALDLWKDPLITPYCPACFFNRKEKPFKRKRREYSYPVKK